MLPNPAERFTGRVESYRLYRPTYPPEIANLLRRDCALPAGTVVADLAAGTGLFTEVLLAAGLSVVAVEPNAEMRAACATLRQNHPNLRLAEGTAESTNLPGASVDLITVAQAMHWFHLDQARSEFARILKPGGHCAVIYNNRHLTGDPFHDAYEQFLRDFGSDYLSVKEQHVGRRRLAQFFAPAQMHCATLPNAQSLTVEALEGRIRSSSYIPREGHPRFEEMRAAVHRLFADHQSAGAVTIRYDCVVCYGQLIPQM